MVEYSLTVAPVLNGFETTVAGTSLSEQSALAIVAISIPVGKEAEFAKAVQSAYGCAVPDSGQSSLSKDGNARVVRVASDQVFVVFDTDSNDAAGQVRKAMKNVGYFVDQTHNWVALNLEGSLSRDALSRICAVNLHADVFAIGAVARTPMEHMGAIVTRVDDDAFLLMSASSSAGSFAHAVETSLKYVA